MIICSDWRLFEKFYAMFFVVIVKAKKKKQSLVYPPVALL